jgi:hypothetical protein
VMRVPLTHGLPKRTAESIETRGNAATARA